MSAEILGAKSISARILGAKSAIAKIQGAKVLGAEILSAEVLGAEILSAEILCAEIHGAKLHESRLRYCKCTENISVVKSITSTLVCVSQQYYRCSSYNRSKYTLTKVPQICCRIYYDLL